MITAEKLKITELCVGDAPTVRIDGVEHLDIGKIFDCGQCFRFEKLNENVSGTGLGLSICQSIIHRLGGDIWIDSSYNKGARFVFSHPIPKV